jgi:hypothetical protein
MAETDPIDGQFLPATPLLEETGTVEIQPMTGLLPPGAASRFSMSNGRRFFDLSTKEVITHLKAAANPSNPEFFGLLQKPDLYGALWVPASVSFVAFAFSNLTNWFRVQHGFEYNFGCLVSAFFWLIAFVFGTPFLFKYLGTDHSAVNLMTLFGYSTVYIVPSSMACVLVGKKLGFVLVLAGALTGAYSIARKTGEGPIQALPGTPGRGELKPPIINRMGLAYLALHIVVHLVCFL